MIGLLETTTLRWRKRALLLIMITPTMFAMIYLIFLNPRLEAMSRTLIPVPVPIVLLGFITFTIVIIWVTYFRRDYYKFKFSRAISIQLKQRQCYKTLSQKHVNNILSIDEINLITRHYSKTFYNTTDLESVKLVIILLINQIPHLDKAMQTDVAYKIVSLLHHYVIFYENYDFALSEINEDTINRCFELDNLDLHVMLMMIYAYTGNQKYQNSIETFLNVNANNFQVPFNHLKVLEHVSSKQNELS